ncbi:MAG TPA: protein kinase, partial [Myxococcota bacterium]
MENAEIDRLVMKPTARRRLGKYVLLGRVGHGGMGKIYLGYAPGPAGIEKLLVVKRLHGHLTSDPVLVNSFLDEARLSMALNHPNIVHTYDVGEVDGRYFMVMEYIEGQNLGVLLRTAKRNGAYPSSALWAGLFVPVLDALHYAHNAKDARGRPLMIIHRDVSPQNVLVTYDGLPKLVDFGIAKAAMRVSETDAGVLKGKYAYMSPEQVRGEALDPRSDVFAAGIVLWEMLAGRRLYKAETIVRSIERILTEAVISPVRVNPECDPEIAKVAFKALQKDRNQRFSSALELKNALEEAMKTRARQTDVRDLMVRLFGDVIDKQRAVLEACLSEGDAQPLSGDDDDGREPRRPSDSESDVSSKAMAAAKEPSEITTPSAVRASPLVTADAERAADEKHNATSVDRVRRAPSAPRDPAQPAPPAKSRRALPLVAAALGLLLVLLVVVVVVAGHLNRTGLANAAPPVPAPVVAPVTPPVVPPVTAPVVPPVTVVVAPIVTPVVDDEGEPKLAIESHRGVRHHVDKKVSPVVDKKATPEPEAKKASDEAPEVVAGSGTLSLDTVPWTIVYLGKK